MGYREVNPFITPILKCSLVQSYFIYILGACFMQKEFDLADVLQKLDGKGGMSQEEVMQEFNQSNNRELNNPNPYLLTLNSNESSRVYPALLNQLSSANLINSRITELLQEPSHKPRMMRVGESVLLTLKFYQPLLDPTSSTSIQSSGHHQPEAELQINTQSIRTLRVCINEKLILLVSDGDLAVIDKLQSDLAQQIGINNSADLLIFLMEEMTQLFSEYIEDLHDDILNIEDKLLESELTDRTELISIRKSLTILRRNLSPIKDIVFRLAIEKLYWLETDDHQQLHDIAEHLRREIEEVDACIARTAIVSEELNTMITDNINKRIYIMSIFTVIFLPVTFITGLFGVNLGGIPGNESIEAFAGFSLILLLVLISIVLVLKVKKWF